MPAATGTSSGSAARDAGAPERERQSWATLAQRDFPGSGDDQSQRQQPQQPKPPPQQPQASAALPAISLPKGGGAIRPLGEKFSVNPATGSGSLSVPIATSPSRSPTATPSLSLSYSTGGGNGAFGLGWQLSIGSANITRKTDKGIPRYWDSVVANAGRDDVFIIAGAEDLVVRGKTSADGKVVVDAQGEAVVEEKVRGEWVVRRYAPRIEGAFLRVERWMRATDPGECWWKTFSRDGVVSVYGKADEARIFDPEDAGRRRIFSWLLQESYDLKGNVVWCSYKPEDSTNVPSDQPCEANRTPQGRAANRYIKSIKYGNKMPNLGSESGAVVEASSLPADTWMFEVLFDYGEHDALNPTPGDLGSWPCRSDPFSSCRSGFEVRTYRLCRRILMFHHLPQEEFAYGRKDCLVSATVLGYDENPIATKLVSVTHIGFALPSGATAATGYVSRSLPAIEFEYTPFPSKDQLNLLSVKDVDAASLEGLPIGTDGSTYRWLDLDGEGLPGVLTEGSASGGSWFYKRNTSANNVPLPDSSAAVARFSPPELVATKPNVAIADATFVDVLGDGNQDVVVRFPEVWGFWEREVALRGDPAGWAGFTSFQGFPNINAKDPNTRFLDLTGDGLADILLTEDCALNWYPALGRKGYGAGRRQILPPGEEKGPKVLFSDTEQTVYLADMSGDGLVDIARVRNGAVAYWQNLGYGVFGPKVTMGNSPVFDNSDAFNQKRVILADVDGSGTTDLVYLTARGGATVYFNESGNGFSNAARIESVPEIDSLSTVAAVDLLGNGTSCLVWTSPLPGNACVPMRYVDLTGGVKPHLLNRMTNNLGAESLVTYAASTNFYLQDKHAERPWLTRLPFPVQCVESVISLDHVSRTRLITKYAYHHGFFDDVEREFRGFAMVEMRDTEAFAALGAGTWSNEDTETAVPPKLTKTWLHTGVYDNLAQINRALAQEFYIPPSQNGTTDFEAFLASQLPSPAFEELSFPSSDDLREACRALKGKVFRTEVYSDDDTPVAGIPYLVSEHNCTVTSLQRISPLTTQHAVFLVTNRESTASHHERDLTQDLRVLHQLTLQNDRFGNAVKTATVAYGRKPGQSKLTGYAKAQQENTVVIYEENDWTNYIDKDDTWVLPHMARKSTWQISGLAPQGGNPSFGIDDFVDGDFSLVKEVPEVPYGSAMDGVAKAKMMVESSRTVYRSDDLAQLLPVGKVESLALPGESYRLAFPAGLIGRIYTRPPAHAILSSPLTVLGGISGEQGGYVDLDGKGEWWIPSGRQFFHTSASAATADELAEARAHFFMPRRSRDVFAQDSTVTYEYDLRPMLTVDPLGNSTHAVIDYRTLKERIVEDANGNRTELMFDELGYVTCVAVGGELGKGEGDTLDKTAFRPFLTQGDIDAFLTNPVTTSRALLDTATQRFIYDYKTLPASSVTIRREEHATPGRLRIQIAYTDGFGRNVQTKAQVDAGPLSPGGPIVSPRWLGTGWTVYNNKGKPVRKFEPFFDDSHVFRFERKVGVGPITFYDPLDRVAAELFPDRSWTKFIYGPWSVENWDRNDTVRVEDPKTDSDVGVYFAPLPQGDLVPAWGARRLGGALGPDERVAAVKARFHGETPTSTHLDALGRSFLTIAMNRTTYADGSTPSIAEQFLETLQKLDIQGNKLEILDAKGYVAERTQFDMLGNPLHHSVAEAGDIWSLQDALGKQLYYWDDQDRQTRNTYDALRRHIQLLLLERAGSAEVVFERVEYGEALPDGVARNARGREVRSFDQAGVVATDLYDFKGNLLSTSRQVAATYDKVIDHGPASPVAMDPDLPAYTTLMEYDALDRLRQTTTLDGSIIHNIYNDAGLLGKVSSNIRGAATTTTFISRILYNARRDRERVEYGNGVVTTYEYDPATFRLISLTSVRDPVAFPVNNLLQALRYVYDPMGNLACINDDAQQTNYFRNVRVDPKCEYTYDATYQLIEATGREHVGQTTGGNPTPPDGTDGFHTRLDHPGDGKAMARYLERYVYDVLGNFQSVQHQGSDASHPGWTRSYEYGGERLTEPETGHMGNRLAATAIGSARDEYKYDPRGNMTGMPTVREMGWDWRDRLVSTARQVTTNGGTPERTWYTYNAEGRRVRRVTMAQAGPGETAKKKAQRIYVGRFEAYISYTGDGQTVKETTETLHIPDNNRDAALIETKLPTPSTPEQQLIRYQLPNHQDSGALELSSAAQILTYEEYFPFGSTSYQAYTTTIEVSLKRYRFTSKERDTESGLTYHSMRYCAAWLGRWCSSDPAGLIDGVNRYAYARNNPVTYKDPTGTQSKKPTEPAPAAAAPDDPSKRNAKPTTPESPNPESGKPIPDPKTAQNVQGSGPPQSNDPPGKDDLSKPKDQKPEIPAKEWEPKLWVVPLPPQPPGNSQFGETLHLGGDAKTPDERTKFSGSVEPQLTSTTAASDPLAGAGPKFDLSTQLSIKLEANDSNNPLNNFGLSLDATYTHLGDPGKPNRDSVTFGVTFSWGKAADPTWKEQMFGTALKAQDWVKPSNWDMARWGP